MEKTKLNKIFSKAFDLQEWLEILKEVFGAKQLLTQPKPILLNNNDRAKSATELGSFATSDDRIIGLYYVVVNDDIWLERNKVGLRELLRNIYRYDVDGALVVFEQGDKWRLSFISEIKVLNDEGEVVEQATEPKRYTYLLGVDEKVKTPSERLSKLAGKSLALNDILNAFSVEALNEEFYKIISEYFYQLVGGTVGSSKSAKSYEPKLKMPIPVENHQTYQEFVVRLIGRTIFCWFLKMKKSDEGISLVPEGLLSSEAVKNNKGYYHNILERLFFQTLNTKMDERVDGLPVGCEKIPFLNGGLFEPNSDDYYKPNRVTGISENLNALKIEDNWFFELFTELEKYNFTIDENSVTDVEVSVDPEMLGRIFENLLAEIDPDSGETARKATGSFYTPREIVDYMATESLVQYIHNKTSISPDKIRPVFKMTEEPDPTFTKAESECILDALDKAKILDPACGSGAFPMGVLQKIVQALQKLDANANWWKKRQIERISNPIVRKALKEKLDSSGVEYARKIGVIQNSLYGVDIQPIAAEISKLRCFLTLIVDENIDETKTNRGIEPLPNLEFKFVTADTLQKLPEQNAQRGLFDNYEEQERLKELRAQYLQSYGSEKETIKKEFINVQSSMFNKDLHLFTSTYSRSYKLSTWNPFSHDKADWFDPQWMFGIEKFDVVIGNPPFVDSETMTKNNKLYRQSLKDSYLFAKGNWDLFLLFIERGIDLLNIKGLFAFIIPNKLIAANYAEEARLNLNKLCLIEIRDYSRINVFKTADVYPITILLNKNKIYAENKTSFVKVNSDYKPQTAIEVKLFNRQDDAFWDKYFLDLKSFKLIQKINKYNNLSHLDMYEISSSATVSEAYKIKEILQDEENLEHSFKFINTGTIDPFKSLWGNKPTQYIKGQYKFPKVKRIEIEKLSKNRLRQANASKIIVAGMSMSLEGYLDKEGEYIAGKSTTIILSDKSYLLKLLAVINSNLIKFYVSNQYLSLKMAGGYLNINQNIIKDLPVPKSILDFESLSFISDYLLLVNHISSSVQNLLQNSFEHILLFFEQILNAMVMELYFEDEFKNAGIEFLKYAERDFETIEGKSEPEQIEIINKVYIKLNEKDNEIRNNLKLMDIKLADIVMPLKTAK
ncbi:MAG TPA: N-6 DNA methylase [Bacteroidales bacterium]|nr:N-6 DNA methylase [Bacteroidales bacterium]